MALDPDCGRRLLAAGRSCRVEQCSHGTVHLTIGALTLRVPVEALSDLAHTLGAALGRPGPVSDRGRRPRLHS